MATLIGYQDHHGKSKISTEKSSDHEEDAGSCNGQFKFTQLWNGIIQHLQENVEVKRRKHKLRSYDNCFTGTDAVDILHHYLQHHGGLENNVTHENVVKLCQVLMESNVFEAVSCSSNSTKKLTFEDTSSIYYRFIGSVPDRQPTTTPCWCEDQRDQEKHDRMHSCRTPCKTLNTPSRKRKRGTSFNLGKQKPDVRNDYDRAFTPIDRNSKRRNSFGVGKFKVPSDPKDSTSTPFERGKKSRNTFGVGRFKAEIRSLHEGESIEHQKQGALRISKAGVIVCFIFIFFRFGESSPGETVFERTSLRRSSFGFGRRKDRQSFRKNDTTTGRVIENPCTMPRADILQNILGQPVNLSNNNGSTRPKRRKLEEEGIWKPVTSCKLAFGLSDIESNTIWKEATIQRLLRLVEIPLLEDILEYTENFVHEKSTDIHRSGIYLSAVNRRSPRLAKPETDPWLAAAHDCLEAHPEGQIIIGNYHGNTPASQVLVQNHKQLLYKTIAKLFTGREKPLIPNQLIQIMMMTVALLARGKVLRAIELTQIVLMMMPAEDRRQLKGLLSFMSEASKEDGVKISFEAFNRMTVIHAFTSCIISCPTLSEIQAKNIVAFMMDCQQKVFKTPEAIKVAALGRTHRIEHGQADLCKVYCNRISSSEFDHQRGEGTRQALRNMTNSIIDDTKISLRDKKQYLQRFQKHYGDLYHKYFSNMI
ncbi:LOW QUALITY PROTEIN: DEP domain-containing protein 7-like [Amphiura filiformis]|uniref:LOW QUALITY PROTEIN: DEP domain-containing protein 7-like n=1 Tax=Amphiura filiformis TaxID=82378 RepID=UPI003B224BCA